MISLCLIAGQFVLLKPNLIQECKLCKGDEEKRWLVINPSSCSQGKGAEHSVCILHIVLLRVKHCIVIVQIQTDCRMNSVKFWHLVSIWNGFLWLAVKSNFDLISFSWFAFCCCSMAPVSALEESLSTARRSWGWSRSLGESTAWSRCSPPCNRSRSRLRE